MAGDGAQRAVLLRTEIVLLLLLLLQNRLISRVCVSVCPLSTCIFAGIYLSLQKPNNSIKNIYHLMHLIRL